MKMEQTGTSRKNTERGGAKAQNNAELSTAHCIWKAYLVY
jgi:hypothetical protein